MITAQFLEIHVLHDDPTFNKSKPNYSKSEDPPAFLAARLPLKFYILQYSYIPQMEYSCIFIVRYFQRLQNCFVMTAHF